MGSGFESEGRRSWITIRKSEIYVTALTIPKSAYRSLCKFVGFQEKMRPHRHNKRSILRAGLL